MKVVWNMAVSDTSKLKVAASGLIPFAFVIVLMLYIFGPGGDLLDFGIALPEITIEKVDFIDSEIQATVRNTGPIPVQVVVADVNDRIQPAAVEPDGYLERYETTLVRIPFEWNEAEPYRIGITIDDGTRFEKEIESAAFALEFTLDLAIFFAIIGTYVGIIPVMIGLLWLPFIKKISKQKYHFFLALTAGLLLFLAIDSIEESIELLRLHYDNVSAKMGYEILPDEGLINRLGYFYISEKKLERAAAFFDLNIINYPKSNNVYDSRGDCYLAVGDSLRALDFFKKALEVGDNDFTQEKIDMLTKNLEE